MGSIAGLLETGRRHHGNGAGLADHFDRRRRRDELGVDQMAGQRAVVRERP
jgi:hypothetical protein